MYALTDISGKHYWIGKNFVRTEDAADYDGAIPFYATRAAAELEVRRQRRSGVYLRAVRMCLTFLDTMDSGVGEENAHMLLAIVCALVRRAGGRLRLPADEMIAGDGDYELRLSPDWKDKVVQLWVERASDGLRKPLSCGALGNN